MKKRRGKRRSREHILRKLREVDPANEKKRLKKLLAEAESEKAILKEALAGNYRARRGVDKRRCRIEIAISYFQDNKGLAAKWKYQHTYVNTRAVHYSAKT